MVAGAASIAAGAVVYRPIRHLAVAADGGGFGSALAAVGSNLLVGAPNLGTAGSTTAHAYLFDPATGTLLHDLSMEVGQESWWQFSVGALGKNPMIGIAPGDESDHLGGMVALFDGDSGATMRTFCCFGGIAAGAGDDVVIGAEGGGGIFDPATGNLLHTLVIPDPDRHGVQAIVVTGRTIAMAAAQPVGVHLFDAPTGRAIGFVGTRHGDSRHFGSALAVSGSTLAVTEIPQVNLFDIGFGIFLGTIDAPPALGGASFGTSLAWAGGLLAVGAPSGGDVGAVHLYDGSGNLMATLPADGAGSGFGKAVVGLGRSVAVGAPTDDGGAVVVFAPCGDGVVDAPVEQCDDGNDDDDDGCDRDCRLGTTGAPTCGDADGDGTLGLNDGVQVLRAAADLASPCTLGRCDVDGNGAIGLTDGVQVLRAAAGLPFTPRCPE